MAQPFIRPKEEDKVKPKFEVINIIKEMIKESRDFGIISTSFTIRHDYIESLEKNIPISEKVFAEQVSKINNPSGTIKLKEDLEILEEEIKAEEEKLKKLEG